MAISSVKRKKMENTIYDVFSALDPSGVNTEKYKKMFSGMTDTQFESFFKKLFSNDKEYLILDVVDYERALKLENIEKAAKILDVPLFERVIMPNVNKDKVHPVVTKYEVPVGYIHVKRLQQILSKKNSTSTETDLRSPMTGQVVGKDKNARSTDVENYALVTLGANEVLREFNGPRSHDLVMKSEMYADIAEKGFVSINDLTNSVENKTSLRTVDAYMIGMGLKTDLVTKDLTLVNTLNED